MMIKKVESTRMIKIDMEMPDKCDECLFCACPWDDFECMATGGGDIIDDVEGEKPYWCPLIECEDEKSCGNCKYQWIGNSKHCNRCEDFSEWEHK